MIQSARARGAVRDYEGSDMALMSFLRPKPVRKDFVKNFTIPPVAQPGANAHRLAITAIIKDEAETIREWIEFHRVVGVERFYLYDNGSTDGTLELLRRYVASGVVELIAWPHFIVGAHTQALAYAHALVTFGPMTRWMAFVDADEFLFGTREDNLVEILREYGSLPAVIVYRHFFGTSGHRTPPPGLTMEHFTQRLDVPAGKMPESFLARTPKSIVQPSRVQRVHGAHFFIVDKEGSVGYDEQRRPLTRGSLEYHTTERLRINHYYTRDLQTFERRRQRTSSSATNKPAPPEEYERNRHTMDASPIRDDAIVRFVPRMREALERSAAVQPS
jgi:hypothetical protein